MRNVRGVKVDKRLIPFYILLITCSLKWLFEGILGRPYLEVFTLMIGLLYLIYKTGFRIKKGSLIWLLYIFNLLFSVLFHNPTIGRIGRVAVMIEITCFVFFGNLIEKKYFDIYRFLMKIAYLYAAIEMLQFLLKNGFNNIYFPMLIDAYRYVAKHYYNQGYYFGLIFNPHEISSLIAITIVALTLWQLANRKKNILSIVLSILLLVPLLLTQKKGVIFLSFVAFFFVVCVLYASRKQWIKIVAFIGIVGIGALALYIYISNNNDNILFYRFIQFVNKINAKQSVDSGRAVLQQFAIVEFKQHKWFGIGWRMFNSMTTTSFGYDSGHEVNMDYLQWLCETGLVGFTMNMIPVLVTLYRTIYVCRKYVKTIVDVKEKWSVLVAVFSQFFTLMYAFIEIPFYDILVFTLFIISCMVINNAYLKAKQ